MPLSFIVICAMTIKESVHYERPEGGKGANLVLWGARVLVFDWAVTGQECVTAALRVLLGPKSDYGEFLTLENRRL